MRISTENMILILIFLSLVIVSVLHVFGAIEGPSVPSGLEVLNLPSLGIVFGGLMIATLISYPASLVREAVRTIFSLFSQSGINNEQLKKDIKVIIEWMRMFRTNRSEALKRLQKIHKNNFEGYLISLMSTNYSPEEIKELAGKRIETRHQGRSQISRVLQSMGNTSPAFGMLGTLFGLIVILDSFEDAAQLGRGLSMALMTTLYGLMFAHFVFFPLALKVKVSADKQKFRETMILEGVLMIRRDKPAMIIRDQLSTYLDREVIHAA